MTLDDQVDRSPEVDEADGDISDAGQGSFAESPSFIETPNLMSSEPPDATFSSLWARLLEIFKNQIPSLMELNGLQAVPFLQVSEHFLYFYFNDTFCLFAYVHCLLI